MAKKDLKKELQELYFPPREPVLVTVPPMNYLMVDGKGDPSASGSAFQEAIGTLYGMSYTLKFMSKKAGGRDYVVMPLEALWSTDAKGGFSMDAERTGWWWTAMILQPDHVTKAMVKEAAAQLKAKKDPPGLARVRFERFREGCSAQVLHVGPYAEERPTIERLHAFIHENGLKLAGKHHEIYMGDPRRTDPKRLKTVLRQPVRK